MKVYNVQAKFQFKALYLSLLLSSTGAPRAVRFLRYRKKCNK